jgi:hypothetical protein
MRNVAEVPHPLMHIQIISWNGKYLVRYELDRYEQTIKVGETETAGLEEVQRLASVWAEDVLMRFVEMRRSFTANPPTP